MADKPILFSAPMIQALLAGRKTQTRRVLKPQPHDNDFDGPGIYHPTKVDRHGEEQPGNPLFGIWAPDGFWTQRLPYAPGDRLWVREGWRTHKDFDHLKPSELLAHAEQHQRGVPVWLELSLQSGTAEDRAMLKSPGRYRSGRFMPRWASRFTLLVTDVRVQRLHDISEADALAEGVERHAGSDGAIAEFEALWNSINGPDAWDANPWVCAITFDVVRANIDQAQS